MTDYIIQFTSTIVLSAKVKAIIKTMHDWILMGLNNNWCKTIIIIGLLNHHNNWIMQSLKPCMIGY